MHCGIVDRSTNSGPES